VVEHGPRAALAADPASRYARLRRTARVADTAPTADDATWPDLPEEVVA
jgi:hypothetical protein